jgi:hypothetical protein
LSSTGAAQRQAAFGLGLLRARPIYLANRNRCLLLLSQHRLGQPVVLVQIGAPSTLGEVENTATTAIFNRLLEIATRNKIQLWSWSC